MLAIHGMQSVLFTRLVRDSDKLMNVEETQSVWPRRGSKMNDLNKAGLVISLNINLSSFRLIKWWWWSMKFMKAIA